MHFCTILLKVAESTSTSSMSLVGSGKSLLETRVYSHKEDEESGLIQPKILQAFQSIANFEGIFFSTYKYR